MLDKGEKRKIGVFKKNENVVSKPYLQRPRKLEAVRNRLWTDKREGVPRHGQKMGSPVGAVLYSDGWGAVLIELNTIFCLHNFRTSHTPFTSLSHPTSHQIMKAYRSNQSSSLLSSIISNIPSSSPSIPPSLYSSRKPIHHYLPQFVTTFLNSSLPFSIHHYLPQFITTPFPPLPPPFLSTHISLQCCIASSHTLRIQMLLSSVFSGSPSPHIEVEVVLSIDASPPSLPFILSPSPLSVLIVFSFSLLRCNLKLYLISSELQSTGLLW